MGRLNFLYLLGPLHLSGWDNNEIRYSLRSICKAFDVGWVGIVGPEMPAFLTGVEHIPVTLKAGKFRNLLDQLYVATHADIPEDLVLMNDDFMVRPTPVWDWTPTHLGPIPAEPTSKRQWHRSVHATGEWVKTVGVPNPINYEGHTPFRFARTLGQVVLTHMLTAGNDPLQFRTAYGNYWNIGGQQRPNAKQRDPEKWPADFPFMSLKAAPSKQMKAFLQNWLPEPCVFETKKEY
jgi:hypothetical protein